MAKNYKTLSGGYLKKTVYNGDIIYQDVAKYGALNHQPSVNSSDSLLSQRNFFTVTTRGGVDISKIYKETTFGGLFHTQQSLNNILDSVNSNLILNYDQTDLTKLCYYGSLSEYGRVTVENIFNKWCASVSLKTNDYLEPTMTGGTYFDSIDKTLFNLNVDKISNPFDVNIYDTISTDTGIKNFIKNWDKYVVSVWDVDTKTFSTGYTIDNLTLETQFDNVLGVDIVTGIKILANGDPFSLSGTTGTTSLLSYHIKPNDSEYKKFKDSLIDFEKILLLNETPNEFFSTYTLKEVNDDGVVQYKNTKLSWKRSDGYNIDFSGDGYNSFVLNLLEITDNLDSYRTDIIYRFLIAENILTFDSMRGTDYKNSEDAVIRFGNMLRVFGASLDDIKKYIDGISYVNTISYDNKNNLSDGLIKSQAELFGWDVFNLYDDISLDGSIKNNAFWKNLVINTPYIWGSKGTRSSIEFLLEYMGIPNGLIELNEHVYVAKNKVDYDTVNELYNNVNQTGEEQEIAIDEDGFPKPLANNSKRWFQSFGGWYRETGGINADYEINKGNNPHIGEYDDGSDYWLQFTELVPDFKKTVVSEDITTTKVQKLFEFDYVNIFNNMKKWSLDTKTYVDWIENNDPKPTLNDCGCELPAINTVFKITFGELGDYEDIYTDKSPLGQCGVYCNTETKSAFTKNDIPPGYSGSTLEYVVETCKYTGLTRDEANTKAQDDIHNNGQVWVNQNGTSGPITYKRWSVNQYTCGSSITGTAVDYDTARPFIPSSTSQYIQYVEQERIAMGPWVNTNIFRYQLNQINSFDCGYSEVRWRYDSLACGGSLPTSGYSYPDNVFFEITPTTQYRKYIQEEKIGPTTWVDSGTTGFSVELVESFDCGYREYRWTQIDNICGFLLPSTGYTYPDLDVFSTVPTTNYNRYVYQERINPTTWVNSGTTGYTINKEQSVGCGFTTNDVVKMEMGNLNATDSFLVSTDTATILTARYYNLDRTLSGSTTYPISGQTSLEKIIIDSEGYDINNPTDNFNIKYVELYGAATEVVVTKESPFTDDVNTYLIGDVYIDSNSLRYFSAAGDVTTDRYETAFDGDSNIDNITISSGSTNIIRLDLQGNSNLSNIDLLYQTKIEELYLGESGIQNILNIPNSIKELHLIDANLLATNDYSNLTNLEIMRCDSTGQLNTMNMSGCTSLIEFFNDSLTGLSIDGCSNLEILSVYSINDVNMLNYIISGLPDYSNTSTTGRIRISDTIIGVNYVDLTNKQWVNDTVSYGILTEIFDYRLITHELYYVIKTEGIYDINFPNTTYNVDDIIHWNGFSWDIIV